jgi:membrane protease YdiL (CAAX protease family)
VSPWFDEDGRLRLGWRIGLAFIVALWLNQAAMGVASALTANERYLDLIYRPLAAVLLIVGFSILLLFADRVGRPIAAMGLGLERGWARQFALGCALGAGMICVAVLCLALFGHLHFRVTFNGRVARLIAMELAVLLGGALTEELMFRGYPFQRLIESFRAVAEAVSDVPARTAETIGGLAAAVLLSVLFGAAHLWNPHSSKLAFVNTVAVGVLLSFAYLRTRALWLPWGIHFAWNTALGLGFGLPVSGLTDFSVAVHGRAVGPGWLTGGAYGIEASATGTAVIAMGFLPLFRLTRTRPATAAEPDDPDLASSDLQG